MKKRDAALKVLYSRKGNRNVKNIRTQCDKGYYSDMKTVLLELIQGDAGFVILVDI